MHNSAYADPHMMRAAAAAPYLEREEEHQLALAWAERRDQHALHRLATAHIRLVISVAARFRRYGLAMNDLIQEGHIGLLEAAARFDPHRGVRFSTYATWWIRASIQDHILRNWSIVRSGTSSNQKSLFFSLRRLRAKIASRRQDMSSDEMYRELANAIGVSVKEVERMDARLSSSDMSLNATLGDEEESGAVRQDFLVDDSPQPDEMVQNTVDSERRAAWLGKAMRALNDRERKIIVSRRLNDDQATLERLGDELGISKERVRQIENRAMEKLRGALMALDSSFAG